MKISADGTPSLSETLKTKESKTLEKLSTDFESFFITSMLKEMEKTTRLTKKGFQEETYMGIMYEKLGDYLASKGLGIKEMIQKYAARGEEAKVSGETGDNKDK